MKLSLCITAYDGDFHLLDRLLLEFQKQTAAPFEVIVFCSGLDKENEESTIEIAKTKVPIRKFFLAERKMQSFARNFCADKSLGDWVMFFDVDDFPHPRKIQITEHVLADFVQDFVVHSYQNHGVFYMEKDFQIYHWLEKAPNSTNIFCGAKKDAAIHHAHITVRRECFRAVKFNESKEFYRSEDGKFCQDLLDAGFQGAYVDLPLIFYTQ